MIEQFLILGIPLRKYLIKITIGLFLIIGGGIANIFLIGIISDSLQSVSGHLLFKPLLFFSALLLAFILSICAQFVLEGLGHQIVYQIRENLLRRVVQADPEYFQQLEKSKVYNLFSQDIPAILTAIQITPYALYGLSIIVVGFIYMLWLSWATAIIIIGAVFLVVFTCNALVSLAEKRHQRDRHIQDELVTAYSNIISGHKELALNEIRSKDVIDEITSGGALESKKLNISAGRLISISSQLMGILPIALIGCVLWVGTIRTDTFADIAINFAVVLMFIRQPIGNLVHQVEVALQAKIAFNHLHALELLPPHNLDSALELKQVWDTINFSNVVYRYASNGSFSLGPVDLQIKRGEITFLVGSNGAGKSTLLKLICGLLTPLTGLISIDDELITQDNRRQYRAMFSAVLSDFYLFDNVPNRQQHPAGRTFESIVRQLELEGVLSFHDKKIDTVSLSSGQKKRLAMLIACMDNRSIMVLDEWAADQDPRFRKIFYQEILPQLKSQGVTLIVISHDDRYFHTADTVVSIESGVIRN